MRVHSSSGTTGKPTVVGYTAEDIDLWAEVMARSFGCAGVGKGDIIQNAYGYGMFTGGLGAHYGGEKCGATVIPISGGNTKRQLMILEDFGSTALVCCTPSYSLYIAEVAQEMGIDIRKLPLKVGIFGAEPWSDEIRKSIEDNLEIDALDIYGLSEIIGPGVSMECMAKDGLSCIRRPLHSRDYRSGERRSVAGGQQRRTGVYHREQTGVSVDPLPYPRCHQV